MTRETIAFEGLRVKPHALWASQWLLLSSGDFAAGKFNSMAVGWGSLGTMWGKPFAQVVIRPGRYTYQFMEKYDTFTLCAFPERLRGALQLLGTKSGRDGDKIAESGLTPTAATCVAAPVFAEAELAIECRKMYWHDIDPGHFLTPRIAEMYPLRDYHRTYFGEIVAITGVRSYRGD